MLEVPSVSAAVLVVVCTAHLRAGILPVVAQGRVSDQFCGDPLLGMRTHLLLPGNQGALNKNASECVSHHSSHSVERVVHPV